MLCILKAIAAWLAMLFASVNLIGFVVRGLIDPLPSLEQTTESVRETIKREYSRMVLIDRATTIISVLAVAGYLYAIFHYANLGLALVGGILMIARIPALIWEMRAGQKPTREFHPNGPVYSLSSTFTWASLILVWYSLCKWNS